MSFTEFIVYYTIVILIATVFSCEKTQMIGDTPTNNLG